MKYVLNFPREESTERAFGKSCPDDQQDNEKDGSKDLAIVEYDPDDGLIDLVIEAEEEMEKILPISERIASAIEEMGNGLEDESEKLSKITELMKDPASAKPSTRRKLMNSVKQIASHAANRLDSLKVALDDELPQFQQHLDDGLGAMVRSIPIYIDMEVDSNKMTEDINELLNGFDSLLSSVEGLDKSLNGVPNLTRRFARSKKSLSLTLRQLISTIRRSATSFREASSLLV